MSFDVQLHVNITYCQVKGTSIDVYGEGGIGISLPSLCETWQQQEDHDCKNQDTRFRLILVKISLMWVTSMSPSPPPPDRPPLLPVCLPVLPEPRKSSPRRICQFKMSRTIIFAFIIISPDSLPSSNQNNVFYQILVFLGVCQIPISHEGSSAEAWFSWKASQADARDVQCQAAPAPA